MTATKLPETKAYLRLPADLLCVKAPSGIAVQASTGGFLLEGDDARALVEALFPLLDGTRTEADILAALPRTSSDDVRHLLVALQDHGLLSRDSQPVRARLAAGERIALLGAARVLLAGAAGHTATAAGAMHAAGVGSISLDPQGFDGIDIAVGIFDESRSPAALDFASRLRAAGILSLTCITSSPAATIGPLTIPGRTACWNCGRLRLHANTVLDDTAPQSDDGDDWATAIERHLTGAVCEALCSGADGSPLVDHVLVLDAPTMRTSLHRVLPVPGCRICGGSAVSPQRAPDTSHHASPDDAMLNLSLRMLSSFVDDRTGIVNRVVLESAADTGVALPVVATAITAAAPDDAEPRQMPIGWGKGCNAAEAVVGAIAEAIERYAGSMPDAARIVWSQPHELSGDLLHPHEFALYADDQFKRAGFPYVRFDPNVVHPWIAGEWAGTRDPVWVPALLIFLSLEIRRRQSFCQGTSNGMAAGTVIAEAQLRAILELLERDAFMTSWLCRRPGRRLRVDATLEPDLKSILDGTTALGADVELVLLESACGYPTIACLGFGDGINWPGVTFGLGTDPDPRNALRQAILEFGQTGPFLRKMMRNAPESTPTTASAVSEMMDHARYYFPLDRARAFNFLRDEPDPCALADLPAGGERSLKACAEALAAHKLRVALVDVTPTDIASAGFVVARAVSPDLQPISFGHGLDRLPIPRLEALGARHQGIAPLW